MSGFSNLQTATRAFSTAAAPFPKKSKRRYTPPFSLRLTAEERKRLDELAGNQPLGSYIRNRILGEQAEKRRKTRKPVADTALLALILSEMGRSRLASNINQLARTANMGALDIIIISHEKNGCR